LTCEKHYVRLINVITFSHLFTTYILLIRLAEWMTMTLKCRVVALSQTLSNKIYDVILLCWEPEYVYFEMQYFNATLYITLYHIPWSSARWGNILLRVLCSSRVALTSHKWKSFIYNYNRALAWCISRYRESRRDNTCIAISISYRTTAKLDSRLEARETQALSVFTWIPSRFVTSKRFYRDESFQSDY